ncbi:MAG: twin transmembrane helix small protein [Betaproteobacteria bacterium]|nr:twin transmembrane helix small protein [Betaproteobacteria bacterium]
MKTVMVLMLVAVLGALASAGVFMLRKGNPNDRRGLMARALAVRVGLSVALFLFILLSWYMGWVKPTGLPTGH